jgi:hypothetical protein
MLDDFKRSTKKATLMTLLQQLKNLLAGKAAMPLLTGAAAGGTLTENAIAAIRRTARHPLTEGAVLLAGSQYVAAAVGLVTSVVSARLLGPKDFGLAAVVMSYPMLLGSLVAVKSGSVTTRYIARFRWAIPWTSWFRSARRCWWRLRRGGWRRNFFMIRG